MQAAVTRGSSSAFGPDPLSHTQNAERYVGYSQCQPISAFQLCWTLFINPTILALHADAVIMGCYDYHLMSVLRNLFQKTA
jgi:hypothetical protein